MHLRFSALAALGLLACVDPSGETLTAQQNLLEQPARTAKLIRHAGAIAGRYIVVLDAERSAGFGPTAKIINDQIDQLAATHSATVEHRYTAALRGFSAALTEAQATALAREPGVAYVEEDTPVYAFGVQANPTYGLDRVDQPSLPLDSKYTFPNEGEGSTVFVIDTGINTTHVEFTGHLRDDLGRTVIDDGNGIEDCNGHGTHVAGTVAGTVFGVAKKATIIPIRVLDCDGSGSSSGVIAGMDYVAQNHPQRSVVNMSLGGAAGDAKDAAVRNLVASGVTVVVAAGNENTDACDGSPAREPMAITVASSTSADERSSFSNYGRCVDLFAPGSGITSAWIDSDTEINTISGTSMASPHVAGAAALFLAANPNATPAQVTAGLLGSAVAGKIGDVQGSPNKLLQVNFTAGQPPAGSTKITAPLDRAEVMTTFDVAVDAVGATKVELGLDGVLIATDDAAPFAFTVTAAPVGMHQLIARGTDASGQQTTHMITITVSGGALGGGGGHPLPVPMRRNEPAACSTAPGGSLVAPVLALLFFAAQRRRRRRAVS